MVVRILYIVCNLYCAPFWYDSTKTAMKNLKVAYNNRLRRLLGLPSHNSASSMFVNLNISSFGELLRKYVYNFRHRLETSDHVIIRRIYLFHFPLQPGIWDWWRDILSPIARAWLCVYDCILSIFFLNINLYNISVSLLNLYMDCASEINM